MVDIHKDEIKFMNNRQKKRDFESSYCDVFFMTSFFPTNLISYSLFSPNKLSKEHNEFSNRLSFPCPDRTEVRCPDEGSSDNEEVR